MKKAQNKLISMESKRVLKFYFYDDRPPYNKMDKGEYELQLEPNSNGFAMLCKDLTGNV